MSHNELTKILNENRLWVESGGEKGERAVITQRHFNDLDFSGLYIRGAKFEECTFLDVNRCYEGRA